MKEVLNKIKNVFKIGVKTSTSSKKLVDVEFQGKKQKALLYIPYGLFVNPQDNLPVGLLADQGNEESMVAFVFDIENRADDLESGEVAIGIPGGSAKIIFRSDGKIYFKIGDVEGGDFAVRYLELETAYNQLKSEYDDLVGKVNAIINTLKTWTVVPNDGGAALQAAAQFLINGNISTGDITPAKIEEIEFPS